MPSKPSSSSYAEMVAEAEAAVQSVKDPELRRVAFEKILESLLGGGSTSSPKKTSKKTSKKTAKKAATKSAPRGKGPKARLLELIDDGFFDEQRTLTDVKSELADRGFHIPVTSLSNPLMRLTRDKKLRRQKQSTGGKGAKVTYAYSNW
ncbi:MAG TPA: hypothetical protein ENJ00_06010 [Phycisphaerales bacterium]|nr:hypothetical protein [Phycisphaerales bacterium]